MRHTLLSSMLWSLACLCVPVHAQGAPESDSDYLQQRAASLNDRIDAAVKAHTLSKKEAVKLHLSVGRVQTLAGHLQTRNGSIRRQDADQMNQQLTDVERTMTRQP